jgi:hypothetical protein
MVGTASTLNSERRFIRGNFASLIRRARRRSVVDFSSEEFGKKH